MIIFIFLNLIPVSGHEIANTATNRKINVMLHLSFSKLIIYRLIEFYG